MYVIHSLIHSLPPSKHKRYVFLLKSPGYPVLLVSVIIRLTKPIFNYGEGPKFVVTEENKMKDSKTVQRNFWWHSPGYPAHSIFHVELICVELLLEEFKAIELSTDSDIPEPLSGGPWCGFWVAQPSAQSPAWEGGRIHTCLECSASLLQGPPHLRVFMMCYNYHAANWGQAKVSTRSRKFTWLLPLWVLRIFQECVHLCFVPLFLLLSSIHGIFCSFFPFHPWWPWPCQQPQAEKQTLWFSCLL